MKSTVEVGVPGLGERVAFCRQRADFTQKELAERAALSVTFVSEVENGRRAIGSEALVRIADALGVSLDYLVKGTTPTEPPPSTVQFPRELLQAAEEQQWPFAETHDLLRAHQMAVFRRSRSGHELPKRLTKEGWIRLYETLFAEN